MSLDHTDDKSTLVQVMAWCHQATSHYLSQCWPRSQSSYGVTRPQWVNSGFNKMATNCRHFQTLYNTLRPGQNGSHFADAIFKCIFMNENGWIPIKISLKFVPKGPINNITALVQIMAWRQPGDKPLSEPIMVRLPTHICVTWPQWVNNVKVEIPVRFVPNAPVDNKLALTQVMAWRQTIQLTSQNLNWSWCWPISTVTTAYSWAWTRPWWGFPKLMLSVKTGNFLYKTCLVYVIYTVIVLYFPSKFAHMHLWGIHYQSFWPKCCITSSFGYIEAINCDNACCRPYGLARGTVACMNHQFTVTSQA